MTGNVKIVPLGYKPPSTKERSESSKNCLQKKSKLTANGVVYLESRTKSTNQTGSQKVFLNKHGSPLDPSSTLASDTVVLVGNHWIIKWGPELGALILTLSSLVPSLFACRGTEETALSSATEDNGSMYYSSNTSLNITAFLGTVVAEIFLAQRAIKKNLRLLLASIMHIITLWRYNKKSKSERLGNTLELLSLIMSLFLSGGLSVIAALPFLSQTKELLLPYWQETFLNQSMGLGNYQGAQWSDKAIGSCCLYFFSNASSTTKWELSLIFTDIAFPVLFFDASLELTKGIINFLKHLANELKPPCYFGKYCSETASGVLLLALLIIYTHSNNTSVSTDQNSFFYYFKIPEFISFALIFPAIYRLRQSFKAPAERFTENPIYQLLENTINVINVIGFLPFVYLGTRLFDSGFLQVIIIACLPVYTSFINHNLEGPVKSTLKTFSDLTVYLSCFVCEKTKCYRPSKNRTSPRLLFINSFFSCIFYIPLFALMYYTSYSSMELARKSASNLNSAWVSLIIMFAVAGNLTFSSHNLLHMGEPFLSATIKKIQNCKCSNLPMEKKPKQTKEKDPPNCYSLFLSKEKKPQPRKKTKRCLQLFSMTCSPRKSTCRDSSESLFLYLMLGLSSSTLRTSFYMLSELFLGLRDYNPEHFSWLGEFISNLVSLVCTLFFLNKLSCAKNHHLDGSPSKNPQIVQKLLHSEPLLAQTTKKTTTAFLTNP